MIMKWMTTTAIAAISVLSSAGAASAAGELNIYNWGDYTSPELIKKFEEQFDVKVTITDYDSNDTALAKVRAGGHGGHCGHGPRQGACHAVGKVGGGFVVVFVVKIVVGIVSYFDNCFDFLLGDFRHLQHTFFKCLIEKLFCFFFADLQGRCNF